MPAFKFFLGRTLYISCPLHALCAWVRAWNIEHTLTQYSRTLVIRPARDQAHARYRIAGNFRMVQNFAFFADRLGGAKKRLRNLKWVEKHDVKHAID
jgi:hypothetical protein